MVQSRIGITAQETSPPVSFCKNAIQQRDC